MRLRTPFCRRLGLTAPVVQAPIGSAATPELAAAVSNAGGLGMLALTWTERDGMRARIRRTRAMTDRPFGVNLVLQWDQRERVAVCAEESVAVVSTFWGDPGPYVDAIHSGGALHLHTVGSAEEARRAAQAGVDVIVAQGWEAGGRVRGEVATLPLVPAVVDAVAPLPVLAAGGVADGRGLAAVLALGADAGWVGTRFLLAHEASVHDEWCRRIRDGSETSTGHTTAFDGGWPDAPHRVLRNTTLDAWDRAGRPVAGCRPGEGDVLAHAPDGSPVQRYAATPPVHGPPETSRPSPCMPARAPASSPNSVRQPRSSASSHAKPPRHSARCTQTARIVQPPDGRRAATAEQPPGELIRLACPQPSHWTVPRRVSAPAPRGATTPTARRTRPGRALATDEKR
jgi:NAD(P)H-dependent flavin oxidoreductase YrpB (nitropropane dioxygenase family)